jgi:hypothetical protein
MTVRARFRVNVNVQGEEATVYSFPSGGHMLTPLTATFSNEQIVVTMRIEVIDGAPSCVWYRVERVDGGGLEFLTTELAKGLKVRDLMAQAVMMAAVQSSEEPDVSPLEAIESVLGNLRRGRAPISDTRLEEFAEAYRAHWEPGRADAFAASLGVGERQMYRLKKAAVERGFLEDDE